jgi:hypothetical protein
MTTKGTARPLLSLSLLAQPEQRRWLRSFRTLPVGEVEVERKRRGTGFLLKRVCDGGLRARVHERVAASEAGR